MNNVQDDSENIWETGWHGHEKSQLMRMARLPLAEKIKWLEEAQEMIEELKIKKEENGSGK